MNGPLMMPSAWMQMSPQAQQQILLAQAANQEPMTESMQQVFKTPKPRVPLPMVTPTPSPTVPLPSEVAPINMVDQARVQKFKFGAR